MKIIFLDIDGVLNHEIFYQYRHDNPEKFEELQYPLTEIDPRCVLNLNDLIEKTGAKIVISSTWRLNRTVKEITNILGYHGFKGEIIDFTPCYKSDWVLRGNEIYKWMIDNEKLLGVYHSDFKDYIILDDDSDMLYWQKDNFFLVDRYCGLTPSVAYKAIRFLNNVSLNTNTSG